MLAVQITCFVAGAYLVLRRAMPARWAAGCVTAVLWFPPIVGTLAVIWTASSAAGWLLLGTGWLTSERRSVRIAGLVALALGASVIPGGAFAIAPLIIAGFAWRPEARGGHRVLVAVAAWLVTAALAVGIASRFVHSQGPQAPHGSERALAVLQLENRPTTSQVHAWFTDVHDLSSSAGVVQHGAASSRLQGLLRPAMLWFGTTRLFAPYVYLALGLALGLALLPLWLIARRRRSAERSDAVAVLSSAAALVASGLIAETAVVLAGDSQFRGSLWLAVTALLGFVLVWTAYARQLRSRGAWPS
jgi:hypothetical protein